MPEMKGKLKAKNDTTGTIPQTTVHRTHRRKVTFTDDDRTIEIIDHKRKLNNHEGEPENKSHRTIRVP